ncbi:MAG: peptidase M48 Ste24p [Oceanospirillaceae bacterium]|uniref:M48 family metallopeptidase n=1 Tax=unclassified Thalassolituus TaxID=2624967 RepID=UPI000C428D20|nr:MULTISPECIES: M48 family metallopeptidase [unclassified Thalassolituus]MAY00137.1 peptidase M48 Ste24p [Oceanospirillaceae bacterium]MBS51524.1 peptidase M48 Ste24p [Oceanospirillaceae bacterium]|tara:strand:- start:1649 stop:2479 length:831 start_codon:yes stop_codon:yes gene_type:complete
MKRLIPVTLLAAAIAGCATSPTGRSQLMIVSPDSAIVESQKAYASTVTELDSNKQLITDPAWVKRISTITGRLVTEAIKLHPETAKWQWSVAIIDDPKTLNAWCMAGGRMAIYSGIVTQLNLNDDEIAQIMGHEISHALANHTAERMSRAVLTNGALSAAAVFTDNNGMALTGTAMAAKVALELPNSRTAESEADEIGIELAIRAGYRADAAVSLWQKMEKAGGGGTPEFLSTHPSPKNRAKTLAKLGEKMKSLNPQQTKARVYPVDIVTSAKELQ